MDACLMRGKTNWRIVEFFDGGAAVDSGGDWKKKLHAISVITEGILSKRKSREIKNGSVKAED